MSSGSRLGALIARRCRRARDRAGEEQGPEAQAGEPRDGKAMSEKKKDKKGSGGDASAGGDYTIQPEKTTPRIDTSK